MEIALKSRHILLKFCLSLIVGVGKMQENDFNCSLYKKLVFEETKTFSHFLPDASETTFTEDHCSSFDGFVVGGENARPKEFAFAARLGHFAANGGNVNWFCGGTLLSEYFVLTAAHCFYASQ